MIYEFYDTEKKNGKGFTAYDVQMNGYSRSFVFCNNPKKQRRCNCKRCNVEIPQEVPRIKLDASYYYGQGNYCMTCGQKVLTEKKEEFEEVIGKLQEQVKKLDEIVEIADEVIDNKFYPEKMALARMIQVVKGKEY